MIYIMLFPIFFPIAAGLFLLFMKEPEDRRVLIGITGTALAITGASAAYALFHVNGEAILLFHFTVTLPIYFKPKFDFALSNLDLSLSKHHKPGLYQINNRL